MEDPLDRYIRETNDALRVEAPPGRKKQRRRKTRDTAFKRWAASAAMDLFKFYIPFIFFVVSGGIMMFVNESMAYYCLYGCGLVLALAVIFCAIDFYHFRTWTTKLNFKLDGWTHIMHSRNPKYWDMNGERWLSVKIAVHLKEPPNEKHVRVVETFLKKLRLRLNQWPVSAKEAPGYTQPNGWTHDGLVLTGDMNPRVMNLIRKKFSGELNHLATLMHGAIEKVAITQTGPERHHQVYHEPD